MPARTTRPRSTRRRPVQKAFGHLTLPDGSKPGKAQYRYYAEDGAVLIFAATGTIEGEPTYDDKVVLVAQHVAAEAPRRERRSRGSGPTPRARCGRWTRPGVRLVGHPVSREPYRS